MVNKNVKIAIAVLVCVIIALVLVFVIRNVFSGACCAVDEIDQPIMNQINGQFSNNSVKFVVFPLSKEVRIEQGKSGGVGFSIQNTEGTRGVFEYSAHASKLDDECLKKFDLEKANNLIEKDGTARDILLGSGSKMDQAALIKFSIPKTTPKCEIDYKIDVKKDSEIYGQTGFELKIVS